MSSIIHIPVSPAELFDKITVLQIKSTEIKVSEKLAHVHKELNLLLAEAAKLPQSAELTTLVNTLRTANKTIWDSEELIRTDKVRGDTTLFAEQAHISHDGNDERFRTKQAINALLGSAINEVKSHQN